MGSGSSRPRSTGYSNIYRQSQQSYATTPRTPTTNMPMSPAGSGQFPSGSGVFPRGLFPDKGGAGLMALAALETRLQDLCGQLQRDPRNPQLSRDREYVEQVSLGLDNLRLHIPEIQLHLQQQQQQLMGMRR